MFLLNILIIITIFKSRSKTKSKVKTSRTKTKKRQLKFTCVILMCNLKFIILNLPYTIMSIWRIFHFTANDLPTKFQFDNQLKIAYDISMLYYISFFFLNLAFNKNFQNEVLKTFSKQKKNISLRPVS